MSTEAVGTYLHLIRGSVHKLSLEDVATHMSTALGTPVTAEQLRRIEQGKPTTIEILTAFAQAIHADMEHVTTLLAADSPMNAMIQSMVQIARRKFDRSWDIHQRSSQ